MFLKKINGFFNRENSNITQLKKIRSSLDISSELNNAELMSLYFKIEDCLQLVVSDPRLNKVSKKLNLDFNSYSYGLRLANPLLPSDILTVFCSMISDFDPEQAFLRSILTILRLDKLSPLFANLTFDLIRQGHQIPALGRRLKNSLHLLADNKQNTDNKLIRDNKQNKDNKSNAEGKNVRKKPVNLGKFNCLPEALIRETVSFLEPEEIVPLRQTCRSGSAWPIYYGAQANRFFKKASTPPVFVSGPKLALSMKGMFEPLSFATFQMLPNGNIVGLVPHHLNKNPFYRFNHFTLCLLDSKTCDPIEVRNINKTFLNIPRNAHFIQLQPSLIHVYLDNLNGSLVWDIENNKELIYYKRSFLERTAQCVQTKKGDLIVSYNNRNSETLRSIYSISDASSDTSSEPKQVVVSLSAVAGCKFVLLDNGLVAYVAESDPFGTFLFLYNPETKENTQFCKLLDKPIALYPLSNATFLVRYQFTSQLYVHGKENHLSVFKPLSGEAIKGEIIQSPDLNYFAIYTSIKEPHEEREFRLTILDLNKLQRQVFKLEIGLSQIIGWTQDGVWGVTHDYIFYKWPWLGQNLELEHSVIKSIPGH